MYNGSLCGSVHCVRQWMRSPAYASSGLWISAQHGHRQTTCVVVSTSKLQYLHVQPLSAFLAVDRSRQEQRRQPAVTVRQRLRASWPERSGRRRDIYQLRDAQRVRSTACDLAKPDAPLRNSSIMHDHRLIMARPGSADLSGSKIVKSIASAASLVTGPSSPMPR